MGKKYEHIFFDLDHTLWDFDSNSKNTFAQLYDEYNLAEQGVEDFDEFFVKYNYHNDKLWERFRNGSIKRDDLRWKRIWLTLLDYKIGDTALAHELSSAYLEILPTQTQLMPYAKEVLEHCAPLYKIHMITNGFDGTQKLKLQFSGIASYFSEIVTSEKSHSMKPHPEIYAYAQSTTGANADNAIMIGDALEVDIKGARNAGWDQVYFNPHKVAHEGNPTYEVSCLSQLLDIL